MSIESGHVGTNAPKVDEWRDGMVEQVLEYMDLIKDMDAKEANVPIRSSPRHLKRSRTTQPMR